MSDMDMNEQAAPRGAGHLVAKICKITIKALGLILVFGTIIFFLWRVFSSGNPKELERLTPNPTLNEAYAAATDAGKSLNIYTPYVPEQNRITRAEHNLGYFSVTDVKFIDEADQVQVLFRYNNSTIRHLVQDYDLPATPARTDELYDVTLYVAYALTPADASDNDGNDPASVKFARFHATSSVADEKNLYNYRKLIFDGVDMNVEDTPVLAVYVDIYYRDDIHYIEDPDGKDSYGTLIIYDYAAEREPYELSKQEIEALGGAN